ncbi:hypothetical protein, partial [Ventosimonas gracilis]|uniref:hypothetical protein n=1 Tax=Ventosimonas gracilis TaxID=1680762 RepID=UPI00195D8B27
MNIKNLLTLVDERKIDIAFDIVSWILFLCSFAYMGFLFFLFLFLFFPEPYSDFFPPVASFPFFPEGFFPIRGDIVLLCFICGFLVTVGGNILFV